MPKNNFHTPKIDIVIPVKTSLVSLAVGYTLPSVILQLPHNNIYIITKKSNFSAFEVAFKDQVKIIDEDAVVNGLNYSSVQSYLASKNADIKRTGWYFQQFLKLGISKLDFLSNRYLIWDADCVPLRSMQFLSKTNKVCFDITHEQHSPYFELLEKLLGIKKQVDFSFISEHLVFEKKIVLEILDKITTNKQQEWWVFILEKVAVEHLSASGFSEYELYGNYLAKYYPNAFEVRELKKTRNGKYLLGAYPSKRGLALFASFFEYISFETWQKTSTPKLKRYFKIALVILKAALT